MIIKNLTKLVEYLSGLCQHLTKVNPADEVDNLPVNITSSRIDRSFA